MIIVVSKLFVGHYGRKSFKKKAFFIYLKILISPQSMAGGIGL